MTTLAWFDRKLTFGFPKEMLPFFIERLAGTHARLEKKMMGVDDKILSDKLNNKWSVKQHIGHLAEVDQMANRRIGEMLAGAQTLSPAVFEPSDYSTWHIHEVLNFFSKTREQNILKYNTIPEQDLAKSSIHPRLKVPMTPVDLAWFDAEHDDHHLVKINEIIFTLTKT